MLACHALAAPAFVSCDARSLSFDVSHHELVGGPLFGRLAFLHPAFVQMPLRFGFGARLSAEPWPNVRLIELGGYEIDSEYALTVFVFSYPPDVFRDTRAPGALSRPSYIVAAGLEVEMIIRDGGTR